MTEKKYEERQALRALNIPLKIIKPSPTPPGINDDPMALERELAIAKLREQQAAPSPAPAVGELVRPTMAIEATAGPRVLEYINALEARISQLEAGLREIATCWNGDDAQSLIDTARAILKGQS